MLKLPDHFLERMKNYLKEDFEEFILALNGTTPVSLRYNPYKPTGTKPVFDEKMEWCPDAGYLKERPRFVLDPQVHAGGYYVQEASSMAIMNAVDFSENLNILDLCAAPGGKSTLLSSQMSPKSLLVSNEIVGNRAKVLLENMDRWGQDNCMVTHNRPQDFSSLNQFFDIVVVDAPCSGEGMFRKDPAVISHYTKGLIHHCAQRQKQILKSIAPCIREGGRLIYSTCTYNEFENEGVIKSFLNDEVGEFRLVDTGLSMDWGMEEGRGEGMELCRRFYPHRVKGEGFFMAVLEKVSHLPGRPGKEQRSGKGRRGSRSGTEIPNWNKVSKKEGQSLGPWLDNPDKYFFVQRGKYYGAVPEFLAEEFDLLSEKLQLHRPGIWIGEGRPDSLIPAHCLALSTHCSKDIPSIELDKEQSLRYLKRIDFETPEHANKKGWALITYEGLGLGWAKILDNRITNHFPKHLKIRVRID